MPLQRPLTIINFENYEQQAVNQNKNITSDEDEPMDVVTTSQRLQASNNLDYFYTKSVILKRELSAKPKWQATLTDMFLRPSNSNLMSIALFIVFLK